MIGRLENSDWPMASKGDCSGLKGRDRDDYWIRVWVSNRKYSYAPLNLAD